MKRMNALDIYVLDNCWSCEEAARLAAEVSCLFPQIKISLLNLAEHEPPEAVFAVPTYLLNGKVTFLGNPTREQLVERLSAVNF